MLHRLPARLEAAAGIAIPILCAACALLLGAGEAAAEGLIYEFKAGVLYHDVSGLWSGFSLEQPGPDINLEAILTPSMPAIWGSIRPALGASINTRGDTSRAYLDARWQLDTSSGLFFGLGLGAAVHDGHLDPDAADRKALGSRVLFHIPLEAGFRFDQHHSLSVFFEHMSDAGLVDHNEGMDLLGVRYGYRF
jgi:hypothetical protein